jgi:hypothetical protein
MAYFSPTSARAHKPPGRSKQPDFMRVAIARAQLQDVLMRKRADNRITESFNGEEDQLLRAVRHASRRLLGVEAAGSGKIAVTTSHPGASVFIDGTEHGQTPLAVEKLPPGRHQVRLARSGFFDWQGDYYVDPLETTNVWAQLSERPAKWYQKWWVWTAAGAVVVASTGAIMYFTRPPPTTGSGTVQLP